MRAVSLPVTLADVEAAAATLARAIVRTPAARSQTISEISGAEVFLKFENLQFTGSFKERGARNFLAHLPASAKAAGVVAASAGNHAQGVAYHAHLLGIPASIVMPVDTPYSKVADTAHHDARVVLEGETYVDALAAAQRLVVELGATLVPAFDDPFVIAGQGTVAVEMLDAIPDLDVLVVPVGGGGLIAGMAVAAKGTRPQLEIIGAQSAAYPGMAHTLGLVPEPEGGTTIAEGIAVAEPGVLTTEIARVLVDDVIVVSEQAIEEAIAIAIEIEKSVLEGAGAAALAAVLEYPERFADQRVGVVLTGGNIDARVLTSVLLRALARSGRLIRLRIEVHDRPGVLALVAEIVGAKRGNIVDVAHRRDLPGVALKRTMLELSVETRDRRHADEIVTALRAAGFSVAVD